MTTTDATETTNFDLEPTAAVPAEDMVIHLREWGTEQVHLLPQLPASPLLVGAAGACHVKLSDRSVAPLHARLNYDGDQWWIVALGGKDLRQDGIPRARFVLTPGVEVRIGATTLIAESARMVQLRAFCQRLLGWGGDRLRAVDQALRAIGQAKAHRSSLVLSGDGDLVPVAFALHRATLGDAAPFVVCDRQRSSTRASVRVPANVPSGVEAFMAAAGGSLCVRYPRLPHDIDDVMQRMYQPDSDVQLFVCMPSPRHRAALSGTLPIQLPPLQIREIELPRIVEEYAADAIATLGVSSGRLTDDDRWWVLAHCAESLHEIEKATLRLVALRASPNIAQAAARLGMAAVSLTRWLERRPTLVHRRPALPVRPSQTGIAHTPSSRAGAA